MASPSLPASRPTQYPVQEWASWFGTYGKESMMLCVIWNLIILFKALQQPKSGNGSTWPATDQEIQKSRAMSYNPR